MNYLNASFTIGYPSDGIIQVEEEEEAQEDSDDRDTYTIEEDYRPRGSSRRPNKRRSSAEDDVEGATGGSRKKGAPPLQGAGNDSVLLHVCLYTVVSLSPFFK